MGGREDGPLWLTSRENIYNIYNGVVPNISFIHTAFRFVRLESITRHFVKVKGH